MFHCLESDLLRVGFLYSFFVSIFFVNNFMIANLPQYNNIIFSSNYFFTLCLRVRIRVAWEITQYRVLIMLEWMKNKACLLKKYIRISKYRRKKTWLKFCFLYQAQYKKMGLGPFNFREEELHWKIS